MTMLRLLLRHPIITLAFLYVTRTAQDPSNPNKRVQEGWWYP